MANTPQSSRQPQQTFGSSWDLSPSPDGALPHHLAEWTEGSAVAPELASANLQSLSGSDVLETLAGDRLEQLGGWSSQLATGEVRKALRPLEPLAEAGGWWCSGLDPLADWAPMAWGQFKPDKPRQSWKDGEPQLLADGSPKWIKYEGPIGVPTRSIWLRVPAKVAAVVARRFERALPRSVLTDTDGSRGAFWRWWCSQPCLPLLVTEGAKKAGALLSAGIPAVALPGVDNGAKRSGPKDPATGRSSGPVELLPDLAGVPLKGRRALVLFDWSDNEEGRRQVRRAANRLGRQLDRAGAAEVRVGLCPGPAKGADDHLAAGGTWEQLEAVLEPLTAPPVMPWLRRCPEQEAPAGQWLGVACPIPSPKQAPLVALRAPMGSGKTEAIAAAVAPFLQDGTRVVQISHRRSLGAALAERMGLPWAGEAAPGSDLRQQGIALCVDSLHERSGLRFEPRAWRKAVVVIDEVAQVLAHALLGTGTEVAKRRAQVLENLLLLLRNASQVIVADAQLSAPVLEALEQITGERAHLICSAHKPADGRTLTAHANRESWRLELREHLQQRRRLWIATTAQKAGTANSAQNLAAFARQHWPEARVLVVDSETVATPGHDAARLALDPNGIAAAYDLVIATPAVAAGLSVTLSGHFDAVFSWAGGTTDPAAVVQALARVRDDCPRHLYAPEKSPGDARRIGCGATDPAAVLRQLGFHEQAVIGQLLAAANWAPETNSGGVWLPLWAQLAAIQNRQRLAYRSTCLGLLAELEGYSIRWERELGAEQVSEAKGIADELRATAAAAQDAEDQEVIDAPLLSAEQAGELVSKQRRKPLTPTERVQLRRYRLAKDWALGAAAPTRELMEADREGLRRKLRFGWLLQNPTARELGAQADARRVMALGPKAWAPDLCAAAERPALLLTLGLGVHRWIGRTDWIQADDPELIKLHELAQKGAAQLAQVLGITIGQRATTTLRQLLGLAGYKLQARRRRSGGGRDAAAGYEYKVVPVALPQGADRAALETEWLRELEVAAGTDPGSVVLTPGSYSWQSPPPSGVCTKKSLLEEERRIGTQVAA